MFLMIVHKIKFIKCHYETSTKNGQYVLHILDYFLYWKYSFAKLGYHFIHVKKDQLRTVFTSYKA